MKLWSRMQVAASRPWVPPRVRPTHHRQVSQDNLLSKRNRVAISETVMKRNPPPTPRLHLQSREKLVPKVQHTNTFLLILLPYQQCTSGRTGNTNFVPPASEPFHVEPPSLRPSRGLQGT